MPATHTAPGISDGPFHLSKSTGPPGATADDLAAPAAGAVGGRSLIPEVYGSKESSPLIVEVKAGDNDFPLALENRAKR